MRRATAAGEGSRLLRQPDISANQLVFVYGGDLWIANRDGSAPRQLTSHPAAEFAPKFSPDGNWIAFSATYDNEATASANTPDGTSVDAHEPDALDDKIADYTIQLVNLS